MNTTLATGSYSLFSQFAVGVGAAASPTKRISDPVAASSSQASQPQDRVAISPEARELAGKNGQSGSEASAPEQASSVTPAEKSLNLSGEELKQLQKLKMRDTEVRAHEQAHLSVAGQYAKGSASFTMQRGPDGNSYAVGGEVGIDLSQGKTPEETIEKMRTIRRAALAPASPSGADRRIASQASAKEAQARQELMQVDQEELLAGEAAIDGTETSTTSSSTTTRSMTGMSGESRTISNTGVTISALKAGIAAYSQFSG